jgi:hypothetical protein
MTFRRRVVHLIKIGAMPSDRVVSATPALADEHEALLAEARNTADRLRLILDISHTIVADLELQDLLQVVSASLRRALCRTPEVPGF